MGERGKHMTARKNGNAPANSNGNAPANGRPGQSKKQRAQDVENDHVTIAGKPVTYYTAGHRPRTDSPYYVKSRKALHQIVGTLTEHFFGGEPVQDHHGGGLWVFDDDG